MSLEYKNDSEQAIEDSESMSSGDPASPFPLYSLVLLACIAAVFAAQFYAGLDNRQAFAAAFDKQAFLHGEYWRIITGAAAHGGPLHVVMNGYALYSFGRLFEMLSNRAHLAIVFLISAIGGGILSLIFDPEGVSVGASGGIVGLISYLAVYAFRRRQFVSAEFRKSLLINIAFILVFGLVLYQVIDNFGHIGGFITGAVYGFLQIPKDEYTDPREAGSFVQILGLAALGLYIAASIFSILLTLRIV